MNKFDRSDLILERWNYLAGTTGNNRSLLTEDNASPTTSGGGQQVKGDISTVAQKVAIELGAPDLKQPLLRAMQKAKDAARTGESIEVSELGLSNDVKASLGDLLLKLLFSDPKTTAKVGAAVKQLSMITTPD